MFAIRARRKVWRETVKPSIIIYKHLIFHCQYLSMGLAQCNGVDSFLSQLCTICCVRGRTSCDLVGPFHSSNLTLPNVVVL